MPSRWDNAKAAFGRDLQRCIDRSRVLDLISWRDYGPDVQVVVQYQHPTLVRDRDGRVTLDGPVIIGVRYCERFLAEIPHPLEIAAVLEPSLHHPNASPAGMICLGHLPPGVSIEQILHLLWAAITFNMHVLNLRPGEVINAEAADYVRQHPELFPLTEAGLFEAEPVYPSAFTVPPAG